MGDIMTTRILSFFRNLLRKQAVEQSLDKELQSSVEILMEEKMKEGYSRSAARRQALMELGGVEQVKEEVRGIRAGRFLEDFAKDVRFAFRTLAKSPGFTAVAVLTLTLGIGANTAIFSVVHDLVFSPRPYPHAAQVVQLYTQDKKHPGNFRLFSYPTYTDIREESATSAVFAGVLAHSLDMVSIGDGGNSRRAFVAVVSSNYFRTLEVRLVEGRGFLPEEERPGSDAPVVIASYLYWKNTGFDPHLIGKTIRVNERPFTVVGITPEHFTGTMMIFGPELYFPLGDFDLLANNLQGGAMSSFERRDAYDLYVVGRLKPGVTAAAAGAFLQTVAANLEKALPVEQKDQTVIIRPLPRLSTSTSPQDESFLAVLGLMLCALAGIVLFVACLNLAGVLLARGMARRKEIAIRLALGGGRGRIVRQLLTEGLVISLAGGAGGFLIGLVSSDLVAASLGAHMPVAIFLRGGTDPAVFVATLGFCALATLFFALGPALKLTRADVITDLKDQAGRGFRPAPPPLAPTQTPCRGANRPFACPDHRCRTLYPWCAKGRQRQNRLQSRFHHSHRGRRQSRRLRSSSQLAALSRCLRSSGRAARGAGRQYRFHRALRSRHPEPSRTARRGEGRPRRTPYYRRRWPGVRRPLEQHRR